MNEKRRCWSKSQPHTARPRQSRAIKSAKGQTLGLRARLHMHVCEPSGGAVHVAHTGTDQRRCIVFGHVCTSYPPPLPSIIEHNKNQQICRRQRLMWTDKSRKWIWKPPPALCHISLHLVSDKQDASTLCVDHQPPVCVCVFYFFPVALPHKCLTYAGNVGGAECCCCCALEHTHQPKQVNVQQSKK